MLKILVTYAVQGEFVELKWPDIEPYYVRTGIGNTGLNTKCGMNEM